MRLVLPSNRYWLAFVAISLYWAAASTAAGADLTPGQLEKLYERIDADAQMTKADKYDAKMKVLKASLEAGGAYTDAMESLQRYSRIGADATRKMRPEVSQLLYTMSERIKTASDNPVFENFGKISKGEGYIAQAVTLVSDIDRIEKNTNLPPSARRELSVLRSAAEAVLVAEELGVPIPNGIDGYAEAIKKVTDAVIQGAESINTHKDGGLWLTEEKQMLSGLPSGIDYRRTPLFDKGIPVVEEVIREGGRERSYLQIEEGRWTEITKRFDYDQVANIVADYRCLYDGQNPTSREIVKYLIDGDKRKELADESYEHANYLITKDLQEDIAPDMPWTEFVDAKLRLKGITDGLGLAIPVDSMAFRTILKEQITNPNAYDNELRRLAFRRWPNARDYLEFKGVLTTDTIPLDKLTEMLGEYRRGTDQTEFVRWVEAGKPNQPPTTTAENGYWCPTCKKYHSGSKPAGTSQTKKSSPPQTRRTAPPPVKRSPPPSIKKTSPPPKVKKAYPPPVKKKPSSGKSTEREDEFKKDVTHKNNRTLNFHYHSKPK